ncbi:MAG: hypothetical protein Q4A17_03500 [Thermoguttaceae bacterium]|nr:hypothetical protein [Thermoguttaceae bacterium]
MSAESEVCGICDEVKELLIQTEPTEQLTSLDRLMCRANEKLTRLEVLRWGAHPKENESIEGILLSLAADVIRILQEFRNSEPIDPDW